MTGSSSAVEAVLLALEQHGVRFGIYKNSATLSERLAGSGDLDILAAEADAGKFREAMMAVGGVRACGHRFYDNTVQGREDWFVADGEGDFIHLDVSFGLVVGRKFYKHYRALGFEDIAEWCETGPTGSHLKVVSPREEARIAIVRSAFRLPFRPGQAWLPLDRDTSALLDAAAQGGDRLDFELGRGLDAVAWCARRIGAGWSIESSAARRLRRRLRSGNLRGPVAAVADLLLHSLRRALFAVARRLTRSMPGRNAAKRRFAPSGIIIALIGPDGVGKSTQASRVVAMLGRRFRASSVYLGSNDGAWMKYLSKGRSRKERRRSASRENGRSRAAGAARRGYLHTLGSSAWRLIMAGQRYIALERARRLAQAGAIVVADRWPQTLRNGYLDGPSVPPPAKMRIPGLLWGLERKLYQAMERHKPNLSIHLDCDYATSHARKPGDIDQPDFELRIELMREMRRIDPAVAVVDARQTMPEITQDLIKLTWSALAAHQRDAQGAWQR